MILEGKVLYHMKQIVNTSISVDINEPFLVVKLKWVIAEEEELKLPWSCVYPSFWNVFGIFGLVLQIDEGCEGADFLEGLNLHRIRCFFVLFFSFQQKSLMGPWYRQRWDAVYNVSLKEWEHSAHFLTVTHVFYLESYQFHLITCFVICESTWCMFDGEKKIFHWMSGQLADQKFKVDHSLSQHQVIPLQSPLVPLSA